MASRFLDLRGTKIWSPATDAKAGVFGWLRKGGNRGDIRDISLRLVYSCIRVSM